MDLTELVMLVEGGGSHTQVFVTRGDSVLLDRRLPTLNRVAQFGDAHCQGIDQLALVRSRFPDIGPSLFAFGAAATPTYLRKVTEELEKQWRMRGLPWCRIAIANDIVPLFFSVDHAANQLIVISGTGSGVAARSGFDRVERGGAHEYLLGDEGGAFDIGRRGLRAVLDFRDGRGRATVLERLMMDWSRGEELNWFVYESPSPKRTIASFAPLVFAADGDGDPVAGQILDQAAADLARISEATLHRLGSPGGVIATCTGTLLTEPTGRLRCRLEGLLATRCGIDRFETTAADSALLRRTCEVLLSSPSVLNVIARAVPAISI